VKVAIVGAGIAGLVAAESLAAAGAEVTVIDKGRSVGGRLATRRIGEARLDHGAQFFTVRTPAFQRRVDDWIERGIVRVWNHGFDADSGGDGHPRYVGTAGMNSLAKDLAASLPDSVTVETSTMAFEVRSGESQRWDLMIDDGTSRPADAIILTSPLPQTFALLIDSGVVLDDSLMRTDYDRTIALLVTLDRSIELSPSGGIQDADDVFSFIGDNMAKGVSATPACTFNANPSWSADHWDRDADLDTLLRDAAQSWLGDAEIVESQVKKWRLATPQSIWPDPCWTSDDGTIVLAGDAFAGPKVEGAHNSGLAAAHALID
jgi:hypothetical protein